MRKSEYKKKLGVAEGIDHWYDYNSIKDTLTLEKCKDQLHSEIGARLVVEDMVRDLLKQLADKPEAKFKVGDRVTHRDGSIGVVKFVNLFEHATSFDVRWHTPMDIGGTHPGKNLTLYIPPTPAELIPTLKEHEWVRGTYKTGTVFGPYTVYFNEIGAKMAGDNYLVHWDTGKTLDELATLERCDPPEECFY